MSLITIENGNVKLELGKILEARHLQIVPRERNELQPLLEQWFKEFGNRWKSQPITETSVARMDEEIVAMLKKAMEMNLLRHVY